MEFKDYYATLGVERTATPDEIKRAYRKLARKYHPDVTKEADGEARFKEVSEAYEALQDPEKRAAYDDVGQRHQRGQEFQPPPGWDSGFEFGGRGPGGAGAGANPRMADGAEYSDFFESLFGRHMGGGAGGGHGPGGPGRGARQAAGSDHHAKISISLEDAFHGARRSISLRVPVADSQGRVALQERQLDVNIPAGVRAGQHLRLAGQGAAGHGGGAAGDLYLEISFDPHPRFRVDNRDIYLDLPLAPWEAALGASVDVPTPNGNVQLSVPPGSAGGRKMRLKGRGLPGKPPGDMYVLLSVAVPPAETDTAKAAYQAFSGAFPQFDPRAHLEV